MLRNLKDLFDTLTTSLSAPAGSLAPAEQQHTLQLATAVLLVEVMRAEPTLQDSERGTLVMRRSTFFSGGGAQSRSPRVQIGMLAHPRLFAGLSNWPGWPRRSGR